MRNPIIIDDNQEEEENANKEKIDVKEVKWRRKRR